MTQKIRASEIIIIVFFFLMALFTRAISLKHNMTLHPDEDTFYYSTNRLIDYLQGNVDTYEPVKEYPEGAYIFQLPFQLLGRMLYPEVDQYIRMRIAGRISSVYYFLLGYVVGCTFIFMLIEESKKRNLVLIIYGIIICFSLIHIEQSRYGTGDAISFFLLMLLLVVCEVMRYHNKASIFMVLSAGLLSGLLGSIKYPLLVFSYLPIVTLYRIENSNKYNIFVRIITVFVFFFTVAVGFFLVSPKSLENPIFIIKSCDDNIRQYITDANKSEVGGFYNHCIDLLLYVTLYSGVFLAPYLHFLSGNKGKAFSKRNNSLVSVDIPVIISFFFVINLFPTYLAMRTYYPFFCISDMYIAYSISTIINEQTYKKIIALICVGVTIIRGGVFVLSLTEKDGTTYMWQLVNATVDESWSETTIIGPMAQYFMIRKDDLRCVSEINLDDDRFSTEKGQRIKPGELFLSSAQEFGVGEQYFIPVNQKLPNIWIERWKSISTINKKYYRGTVYPRWLYYAFGYWIKGTTGTYFEFPTNAIYYRSD